MNDLQSAVHQQLSADDDAHNFIGSFENLMHSSVAYVALHRILLDIAITAQQLQGIIADCEAHIGGEALCD